MRSRPLLALLLALLAGCQADLRPDELAQRTAPADEARGRQLLAEAAAAQQREGATPWTQQGGVEVVAVDAYSGLLGTIACPWPNDPQKLVFRFLPGRDSGVVRIEDEDGEIRWGIHEWNTWVQEPGEEPKYVHDDDILFWLPTMQYFFEMAFRLTEGAIVDYAGRETLDGRACERVYVTWESYGPHDTVDQYLAYVDQETRRLVRCAFTVRDVAGFVKAAVHYSEFRQVGDYVLPHRIVIGDSPDDPLHVYTIEHWSVGLSLPREELAPDPSREARSKTD